MQVTLVEVSPRDGLQNEPVHLSTDDKAELVQRAVRAGLRRIEVSSFVSPRHVPALADADELFPRLPRPDGVRYAALIVNERGLDRAIAAEVDEVNYVVVASDELSRRNQGVDTAGAIARWTTLEQRAREAGIATTVTIAAAFGCPFTGHVAPDRVADVVAAVTDVGVGELALADTIGVGVPGQVATLVERVRGVAPGVPLRFHFHDTRHTGVANAAEAVRVGVTTLDAALSGAGGCPFAPGAAGNVATEDVAYLARREGWETGVDLGAAIEAGRWLSERLCRDPGGVTRAGSFPAA